MRLRLGKCSRLGWVPGGCSLTTAPWRRRCARCRPALLRGIGDVRAGAEHGHGQPVGGERAFVGGGVDAGGQAAGDAQAGRGQRVGEVVGVVAAAGARRAAADHRHRRMPQAAPDRRRRTAPAAGWRCGAAAAGSRDRASRAGGGPAAASQCLAAGAVRPASGCLQGRAPGLVEAMRCASCAAPAASAAAGVAMAVEQASPRADGACRRRGAIAAGPRCRVGMACIARSVGRKRRRRPRAPSRDIGCLSGKMPGDRQYGASGCLSS